MCSKGRSIPQWILEEKRFPLVKVVQGDRIPEIFNPCRVRCILNRSKSIAEKDNSSPSNDGSDKLSLISAATELNADYIKESEFIMNYVEQVDDCTIIVLESLKNYSDL